MGKVFKFLFGRLKPGTEDEGIRNAGLIFAGFGSCLVFLCGLNQVGILIGGGGDFSTYRNLLQLLLGLSVFVMGGVLAIRPWNLVKTSGGR